jgi:hypothetical protein
MLSKDEQFAVLRTAEACGKIIQFKTMARGWQDNGGPCRFCYPLERYRIKPEESVVKEQPINPQHLGKNAPGQYKHHSKEKCLVMSTGYFYQENEAGSWYWLFKYESGL